MAGTEGDRRVAVGVEGRQRAAKPQVTRRGAVVGGAAGGAEQMAFRGGWISRFLIGWRRDR